MKRVTAAVLLLGLLVSCGGSGGGGGNTTGPVGAASATLVSGSVQAPNGQIAFHAEPTLLQRFANLFVAPAHASLSGLSSVPDGTLVQLIRLSADGSSFTILATTTTAAGRYAFNLTVLGLQFANDLLVRVSGPGGKFMRAFAVGSATDLTPVSEAAVLLALQQLAGAPVNQLTVQEVSDIQGAVALLVNMQSLGPATSVDQAINAVKAAVTSNATLLAFIAATAASGQTTQGPGDIGNYIPLTQGNTWNYQSSNSQGPLQYRNTVTVNGARPFGSVPTTVRSETNPDGAGVPEDDYVVKDAQGLKVYGNNDTTDQLTPQLAPYSVLHFPLSPGVPFPQLNKVGLNYGQDLDGDGRNETADVTSQVTLLALETVSVIAGTFTNTARVQTITTVTVTLSSNRSKLTATNIETIWYAPGVGPIKRTSVTQGDGTSENISEELTSYVVDGTANGALPGAIADTGLSSFSAVGRPAIASDGTNYLLAFCSSSGVPQGISAMMISGSGRITNQIPIAAGDCLQETVWRPAVSFDGTNYLVVYSQNGQIRGSRVSPSGTVLDATGFVISTTVVPLFFQRCCPVVAFDGSNYLVAWSSGPSGGRIDIAAARVTLTGQSLGEFSITAAAPGDHVVPSLVYDGTNYFVIWTDTRQGSNNSDIFGARVAPDGTILDPQGIAIATTAQPERDAQIAFDGTNYFVAWTRVLPGGVGFNPTEIRGSRVTIDGTVLDGPSDGGGIGINTTNVSKDSPTVTFDGSNFLVAWALERSASFPAGGIVGTKVASNGQVTGAQPTPDGLPFSDQPASNTVYALPSIFSIGGRTIVAWDSLNQLAGLTQVLGTFAVP